MIRAASDLYVHTVTVRAPLGHNPDGSGASWSPPTEVVCLIAEETKLMRQPDGTDAMSGTQIYADPTPLLVIGAEVTLPTAPHRPTITTTTVIGVSAVVVGDPAVDGMTAMCE